MSAQALTWSRNLRHPHNLAFALSYAALLKMLGSIGSAATELLDELITLTTEHHFPAYMAVANILRGRLLSTRGQTAEGLVLIRKGLSASANAGASWNQTYFLGLLARSLARTPASPTRRSTFSPEPSNTPTTPTNDGSRRSCIDRRVNG